VRLRVDGITPSPTESNQVKSLQRSIVGLAACGLIGLGAASSASADPSSTWDPAYPNPTAPGSTLTLGAAPDPGCTMLVAELTSDLILTLADGTVVGTYNAGTPLPLVVNVDAAWAGTTVYSSTTNGYYVQECGAGKVEFKYAIVESKWDVAKEAVTPVMPPVVAGAAAALGLAGFGMNRRRRARLARVTAS
jgi:hypothetical protein